MWTLLIYIALLTLAVHLALRRIGRCRLLLVVGRVHVICRAILWGRRVLAGLISDGRELHLSSRWVRRRALTLRSLWIRTSILSLSRRLRSRLSLSLSLTLSLLGGLALSLLLLLTSLPLFADLLEFCGKIMLATV